MNIDSKKQLQYNILVKKRLSEYLGVDSDDISEEDFLKDDLHMNSAEISDFLHILDGTGLNVNISNIAAIESVGDLIEMISENEEL